MSMKMKYLILVAGLIAAVPGGSDEHGSSHDQLVACMAQLGPENTDSRTLAIHEVRPARRHSFGRYLHRYVVAGFIADLDRPRYALIPMGKDPVTDTSKPRSVFAEQMAFISFSEVEFSQFLKDSDVIGTVVVDPIPHKGPRHEPITADNTSVGTILRVGPTFFVVVQKDSLTTKDAPFMTFPRLGLLEISENFQPFSKPAKVVYLRLAGGGDFEMKGRVYRDLQKWGQGIVDVEIKITRGNSRALVTSLLFTNPVPTIKNWTALGLRDLRFN